MFQGADTDQLRTAASTFRQTADDLDRLGDTVKNAFDNVDWVGRDRMAFERKWFAVSRNLLVLTARINASASELESNAMAQDDVSAELGQTGPGGPSNRRPVTSDDFVDKDCDDVSRDVTDRREEQRLFQQLLADAGDDALLRYMDQERADLFKRLREVTIDEIGLENDGSPDQDGLELLTRAFEMSDSDVDVLSHLVQRGASNEQLAQILKGAHVILDDGGALYDTINQYDGRNDRTDGFRSVVAGGRQVSIPENSHHGDDRLEGTRVFGYDTPLLGEALYGRLADGRTWFQLERHSIDVHDGDIVGHGKDYREYKKTGLSQGPWGTTTITDNNPINL